MPQTVLRRPYENTDQPKSHILAIPYFIGDSYVLEDYVLGFDVAVKDLERVEVLHSFADLLDKGGGFSLWQPALVLYLLIEVPSAAELHEDIDALGIGEEPVTADQVGVLHEAENHKLASHLVFQLVLANRLLANYLHGADEASEFVLYEKHLSELTLAQLLSDFEVFKLYRRTV